MAAGAHAGTSTPAPNRGRNISPWPKPGVQGSFRAPEVMGCWCPARGGGKDPASAPLQMDRGEDALGMSNPRELRSWLGAGLVPEIKPSLERVSVSASCCLPGGTLPAQHSPSVVLIPWGMQLTPVPSWMWAIDLLVHAGEELFLRRRGAPCPWGGIASDARGCYHH